MLSNSGLTTAEIQDAFSEEILALGGHVTNTFDDGHRLFTRAILPQIRDVRRGDGVQGGVALKAMAGEVCLFPYVFRLVCQNGAIVAETVGSLSIEDADEREPDAVLQAVREAVGACCEEEVFAENVRQMRTASEMQADLALVLMPLIERLSGQGHDAAFQQILGQLFQEKDKSQFGVANAITAVARETRDPALRWNLEEIGGAIATGKVPTGSVAGRRTETRARSVVSAH